MAPKKPDLLQGRLICAPRSLWPDLPLPKGKTGWEGKVLKRKDQQHHYVAFDGDKAKYFFKDSEIEKWVVEGEGGAAAAAPAKPASKPAAKAKLPAAKAQAAESFKAAAPAASVGTSKRKEEAPASAAAQPSKKAKSEAAAPKGIAALPRPSSKAAKEEAAAAAAEDASAMSKAHLREAILSLLDSFDHDALQSTYAAVVKIKNSPS